MQPVPEYGQMLYRIVGEGRSTSLFSVDGNCNLRLNNLLATDTALVYTVSFHFIVTFLLFCYFFFFLCFYFIVQY
jgi:hypothetical protein